MNISKWNERGMTAAAAAAKSLQWCPTLCDPKDSGPPGSPIPGILQAGTLKWVAIPFSMHEREKWKWSRLVVSNSSRPHGLQPTRLLRPWDFLGKSTGVGCHCLLQACAWCLLYARHSSSLYICMTIRYILLYMLDICSNWNITTTITWYTRHHY